MNASTGKSTRAPRRRGLVVWIALALVLGWFVRGSGIDSRDSATPEQVAVGDMAQVWTCSMDPHVRLPRPGICPVCNMDLVPVPRSVADADSRVLEMSEGAVALAEVQTAAVERRHVAYELRLVGKVRPDETRLADLTTRVAGRLDRLFVDFTGLTVRKGDRMVEIYSPDLYATQQELLAAVGAAKRQQVGTGSVLMEPSHMLVTAARERLRLWGLTTEQVDEIIKRGTVEEHVVLNAPVGGVVIHKNATEGMYVETGTHLYSIADLSYVWVMLDAYESDLVWLRHGQDVAFTAQAYPGIEFHGRVAFIDPVMDDRTRTVKVRVNVYNPDLVLKPDMFVSARVMASLTPYSRAVSQLLERKWMCRFHAEEVAQEPGRCGVCGTALLQAEEPASEDDSDVELPLVIPATAPLITGTRAVVYVRLPDREQPTFEGREVQLGPRGGDWYVVRSGLAEGEQVVVNGAFKLDSELQIRAKPSMMNPTGGAAGTDHDHGGGH